MSRDTPQYHIDMDAATDDEIDAATDDGTFAWKILDELGFDPMNPDGAPGYFVIEVCNALRSHLRRRLKSKLQEQIVHLLEPQGPWDVFRERIIPIFQKLFPTLLSFQEFIKKDHLGKAQEFNTPERPHIGHQRIETLWRLITDQILNVYDLPIDTHLNPYIV